MVESCLTKCTGSLKELALVFAVLLEEEQKEKPYVDFGLIINGKRVNPRLVRSVPYFQAKFKLTQIFLNNYF